LRVNGLAGWVVTDDLTPTFGVSLKNSECLDIVRLTLSDADGVLRWDSGEMPFTSPYVQYGGPELSPRTTYSVEAVGQSPEGAAFECQSDFETGLLGSEWEASWIEPEQGSAVREKEVAFDELFTARDDHFGGQDRLRPCRELRKTFTCEGRPRRARLYATAHGVYEVMVNGRRAGRNQLAPEISTYPDRLYYQTYDVTDLLQAGTNEVVATLADGWWIGRIGLSGDSCQYGDRLGFLMRLDWTEENGEERTVCSDDSFQSRRSHIDYADLFIGERHDFCRSPEPWGPVSVVDYPTANLVAQPIAPVVEWERIDPVKIFESPGGELIADFGKCLAGVAEITVRAPEKTEAVLDFAEVLDEGGEFYRNIMGRNKDQRDVFVCRAGETTFRPRFTYHGFRYVRIAGVGFDQLVRVEAHALGTDLASTGDFSCSDERLNALQRNTRQSERSNMFSIPTDCPQREKMGWTGDILIFAKTGCFNYDLHNFLRGWLANVRAEQRADGEVPNVVPTFPAQDRMERAMKGYNTSAAWGDACVLVPYDLYLCYGDRRVLRENLVMMERWLEFVAKAAATEPEGLDRMTPAQKARNPYLWNKGEHFGDWLVPSFAGSAERIFAGVDATKEVVASCQYAVTVRTFVSVLDALLEEGPDEELSRKKAHFEDLLGKIQGAVREEYVSDDGDVRGDLMGLYVMVLYADIVEGALRERVAEKLARMIEENGYRLDTGFVSTPHLLDMLVDHGYRDLAYRLLFQTESPSWLYMVENGATSIWENWEAVTPEGEVTQSSFNHYALGSVGDWIYRNIGGIRAASPGYRRIVFSPDVHCGLEWAECRLVTPYGEVSCSWRLEAVASGGGKGEGTAARGVALEITVPAQVSAALNVGGEQRALSGGQHRLSLTV